MSQFKVIGIVPPFEGNQFYLRVTNGAALKMFWRAEKIDTGLRDVEGTPGLLVAGASTKNCRVGDRICVTIETKDRKNGFRGIRSISVEILP